ncbi:MAG: Na+/H+ antiporter NhaC family protein [Eubacteriales bacterium]|nr:Na+/H+ antiporter NhaC family protein [Eubacteriales bacterium]
MPDTKKEKKERVKRPPTFAESILAILALIVCIGGGMTQGWPVQPMLVAGCVLVTLLAMRCGWTWKELEAAICVKFSSIVTIVLMNFLIGAIVASLLFSGTVPYLVTLIVKIMNPKFIYLITFLVCCLFSVVTGTSWNTAATVGIAMFAVAEAIGASLPITVAAIVGGASFGDKLSPVSETTNLAPLCAGTDVFSHVRSMLWTTLPAAVVAIIFYAILGMRGNMGTTTVDMGTKLSADLNTIFPHLNIICLIPALIIVGGLLFKGSAMPILTLSMISAVFIGVLVEGFKIGDAFAGMMGGMQLTYYGLPENAADKVLDATSRILQRGGMNGMASTNITVCAGYVYAAIAGAVGFLQTAMRPMINIVKGSRVKLIFCTLLSDLIVIGCSGASYAAHIIVCEVFKKEYIDQGLQMRVLSRTLEDVGTMWTCFLPWTATGAFYIGLFGVNVWGHGGYGIYNINCLLSPVMAMILAITGIGMFKMTPEEQKAELDKYNELQKEMENA